MDLSKDPLKALLRFVQLPEKWGNALYVLFALVSWWLSVPKLLVSIGFIDSATGQYAFAITAVGIVVIGAVVFVVAAKPNAVWTGVAIGGLALAVIIIAGSLAEERAKGDRLQAEAKAEQRSLLLRYPSVELLEPKVPYWSNGVFRIRWRLGNGAPQSAVKGIAYSVNRLPATLLEPANLCKSNEDCYITVKEKDVNDGLVPVYFWLIDLDGKASDRAEGTFTEIRLPLDTTKPRVNGGTPPETSTPKEGAVDFEYHFKIRDAKTDPEQLSVTVQLFDFVSEARRIDLTKPILMTSERLTLEDKGYPKTPLVESHSGTRDEDDKILAVKSLKLDELESNPKCIGIEITVRDLAGNANKLTDLKPFRVGPDSTTPGGKAKTCAP